MNEDDIKQIVDRVLLTIKHAEEPEWNILYDYVTKLQNNWNELKKWVKEYEENSYGLGSYETGIADSLRDVLKKMQELEGNND